MFPTLKYWSILIVKCEFFYVFSFDRIRKYFKKKRSLNFQGNKFCWIKVIRIRPHSERRYKARGCRRKLSLYLHNWILTWKAFCDSQKSWARVLSDFLVYQITDLSKSKRGRPCDVSCTNHVDRIWGNFDSQWALTLTLYVENFTKNCY